MQRAAQGFDAVAGFPVGGGGKGFNNFCHCIPRQNTGYIVSNGRHDFTSAGDGQIGENKIHNGSSNVRKGITVEEKERGATMTLPKKFYRFTEGADFGLRFPLFCFSRCIAL